MNHNLYAILESNFPSARDECAIEAVLPNGSLFYTWADIDAATAKLANLLTSLNLPVGARIAAQTEKSVEALLLYLATLRAGFVYLPLNSAYQQAELAYFIDNAAPSVVVCSPANFPWLSKLAFTAGVAYVFTLDESRGGSLLARAAMQASHFKTREIQANQLAAILYTSGTTGRSKGAMLSHGNLSSNALVLKEFWQWNKLDVLLHALPIFHVHGLFVASNGALINGSKMIWLARFDAAKVVQHLPRATVMMGVPTMYVRLLAEPGFTAEACRNARVFISGSAPLLIETFREFRSRSGHLILERYGMSETTMLTSNPYAGERIGGTVGVSLPGVSVRVRDDQAAPLPAGVIGNIEVQGANVFAGYWQMPEKTAQEFTADGYFKTGDVGKIDPKGYVTIVGRSKDLIISGGYNVYPAEVEGFINELEGVAESALVGVPHPDFGEVGVAVVIAKAGVQLDEAALIAALKKQIANFKIPKRAFVVAELPRNTMGKVQKNLLREKYTDLFIH